MLAAERRVALTPRTSLPILHLLEHRIPPRSQRPDVRYPFFHLKSDGIWSPLDEHGKPTAERFQARFAAMPSDFVAVRKGPGFRDKARRILIAKYFQAYERLSLYALVGMPVPSGGRGRTRCQLQRA